MLKQAIHIFKSMGVRYTLYRVRHELEKKTGVLKRRHPTDVPVKRFITLEQFRANSPLFVIQEREKITFEKYQNTALKQKVTKIIQGEIPFFSSEWKDLVRDYDWITNPDNGYRYDINKHWSEIPDFSVSCLPPYRLFPTDKEYTRERNDILSAVESLLSHQAKLQPNITTGLKYSALPEIATWQGTIVAMRIPYMNRSFNYINFVE